MDNIIDQALHCHLKRVSLDCVTALQHAVAAKGSISLVISHLRRFFTCCPWDCATWLAVHVLTQLPDISCHMTRGNQRDTDRARAAKRAGATKPTAKDKDGLTALQRKERYPDTASYGVNSSAAGPG